ncbi:MAG: ABC transporter substrate-binding protein, partial [Acidimicrobiales bacterium]
MANRTIVALLLSLLVLAASCAGTNNDTQTTTGTGAAEVGALAAACPNPIVIQTDWFPEAEHAATYNLLGDEYEIDSTKMIVRGELQANGSGAGVDLEIRTGGPAIGDQQVSAQMYQDPQITLGFVNTDESLSGSAEGLDTLAVVAPLEISPQMIMWSPEIYPDVNGIA